MDEIGKDVYEYLLNFADDNAIISMLSVNRKFSDDSFFEKVLKRKYPLLIQFRKENESFRSLFVRMVYYIAKLEEEFNIPYIPANKYDPEKFYKYYKDKEEIYNEAMQYAFEIEDIKIVKHLMEIGHHISYDRAMFFGSRVGSTDIIELAIKKGAHMFNISTTMAARYGHLNIVKLFIKKGATLISSAITAAEKRGHLEVVNYLKSLNR